MLVLALVVLVLVGAYRALGGGPPRAADPATLLRTASAGLRDALRDLSDALATASPAEQPAQPDGARDGRRAGAVARQILDSLPTGDELDEHAGAARALPDAAAEDTSWAWRMIAASSTSPGLTRAVEALRDHAAECCASADALLVTTPAGEPVDSA